MIPTTCIALAVAACTSLAHAQPASAPATDELRAAAQRAIQTNPEVTARYNAFRAATNEVDVARGAYYPRVDVNADVGSTRDRVDNRVPEDQTLSRRGVGLSVTQLLWDGLATQNSVSRFGHARVGRYFEFLDSTEQTALEAARAHYDVLRFRRLVQFAEDSYVQHKLTFDQIQSRVRAGVGRGVDLEQGTARLALAQSNLTTEIANLHDVTSRYQRVVGVAPPAQLALDAGLSQGLPASAAEVQTQAITRNAAVSAAVENLRALRAQSRGTRSAFQPIVEARARANEGRNLFGISEQRRDVTGEIVLSWNLFNGGSDQARVRQFADLVTQATDLRDRACRDARQTASIAFNDTQKLADQIKLLQINVASIEKARDAYRQQFDIGQRSLLDLLNAENEVYTARRALANAEHDLRIAYARTFAATNGLAGALGLSKLDTGAALESDWASGEDAAMRCPVAPADIVPTRLDELDARAKALAASRPTPAAPAPAASAPAASAPAATPPKR
ncbi:MAG TPA: TolC family outer membrane protein [Methylibium sp.]|uniref:TolC family outer membrane protein n=1 Tax=Methylibium sp. TaxID=2067992 RepID=UPI002DB9DD4E|nr:TolC family outer membrane protein [Methylibium sp.]HEU4460103.1 TolC family outer membrane protein [Methylibium sp.]